MCLTLGFEQSLCSVGWRQVAANRGVISGGPGKASLASSKTHFACVELKIS